MKIEKIKKGSSLTLFLSNRLDAVAALELDKTLNESLEDITDLTFDFTDLKYISSAGLRTLLKAQKRMDIQGAMRICNVCDAVMEVLNMTGFADFLTIEDGRKTDFSVNF